MKALFEVWSKQEPQSAIVNNRPSSQHIINRRDTFSILETTIPLHLLKSSLSFKGSLAVSFSIQIAELVSKTSSIREVEMTFSSISN